MTYQEIIKHVLMDRKDWVPSYDLEKVSTPYGWIGLRGTRTCRDLAKKGVIEKKMIDGYIHYRWPVNEPISHPGVSGRQRFDKALLGYIRGREDTNGTLFKF